MAFATFERGIHPPDKKSLSKESPIRTATSPKRVVIPIIQHIGAPCKLSVKTGQEVKKGEVVALPEGFVSAPVHSSVSGKITAITDISLPTGRVVPAVVIQNDMKETWIDLKEDKDFLTLSPEYLKNKVKEAGIVGMGGAAFPTHVKLSPPKEKPIDVVIINGAECEPYLTADYRLMLERAMDIVNGLKILMVILGVKNGFIGIENNKPDAIQEMQKAVSGDPDIKVIPLEVKYPQGAEKMLIKACVGREVPPRALPMDVGVVVQNVGTAVAVYEAVRFGKPLIERVMTFTGEAVNNPSNLYVKIGTTISDLVSDCGGFKTQPTKLISGGPMMGFAVSNLDIPITKGTSGVVALTEQEISHINKYGPCIRCGRCIEACPMGLMPSMLSIFSEKGFFEEAKAYNLFDCFECGSCAYVCPSKRPIVQFVRLAKSQTKP
ncbi:MAG: electron transport complex subunit RsxC [Thermodesulfovibrionales bacterium]|nr:electron transport complex subunit RsxC [Thermodesulfovibrionales bacterium]